MIDPVKSLNIIRHKSRPTIKDYISLIFEDFIELKGDRCFGDDKAIIGGIASIDNCPVTIIGNVKGKTTSENIACNFAMAHPEGYRKALRLMQQAEKFSRPVICLIDTAGAFCDVAAEERGQGAAIANNLFEMVNIKTPILSIITGEGGSGGALALAVADEVQMLKNAVYSVISPKGFASILWKDAQKENEAARILKMTSEDLFGFGVIDRIIDEPNGGAHMSVRKTADNVAICIREFLQKYSDVPVDALVENRYQKYRKIGIFEE